MQAKFLAVGSFFIRSRNLFVAVGDIMEGHIQPGMTVAVSLGNISVSATEGRRGARGQLPRAQRARPSM
jgi:integral membrane sensor domain MASE1